MSLYNTLVLFDIDGTLTDARQPIKPPMISALKNLCEHCEIGLVTGSGLEYIKEQLWPLFNSQAFKKNCHILPCNGTEYLIPTGGVQTEFESITAVSMLKELGEQNLNSIFRELCVLQSELILEFDIPLSGHFIMNRESTLNWCPIGRNASNEQRKKFVTLDNQTGLRRKYLDKFSEIERYNNFGITIKLGGDTSFDIYPNGWDKTYALTHFDEDVWDFWFIGDRCYPSGNDYELFELLKHKERAFETSGPEETIEIINNYILRSIK
jgi:phosphomannomutase